MPLGTVPTGTILIVFTVSSGAVVNEEHSEKSLPMNNDPLSLMAMTLVEQPTNYK